ncbi:serine/threonine-protein kinase Akl1p [Monosporozyma servazzii]
MSAISGNPTMTSPTVERLENGSIITVGKHKVEIVDYMAEGGFAQIYKVKFIEFTDLLSKDDNEENSPEKESEGIINNKLHDSCSLQPEEMACLKRVMVQDENGLNELRNEVNVMQKLKDAHNIVQLYDSNAQHYTKYSPKGFEVLILMELCPNKSLLDYMNQRLSTKLSEQEILKIMYDTTMGVAQMHYLDIPLIHRDIKIENVLVDKSNNFKLCDFGSTSTTFPVVTTHRDIAMLSQNIYVHTTPQYRSPEMIDLYKCSAIDEKSDIWALGIFLYKLLFFTTPFERTGQFAILHSKFELPINSYSSKLINLIIIMLSENPNLRPNIYQVMCQICGIINCPVPLIDKYGMGVYDFDQYMWFQNNLQAMQLQLFNLQTKKKQQGGFLSKEDNIVLNQMYSTLFNVSSSIPIPIPISMPQNSLNEPVATTSTPQNLTVSQRPVTMDRHTPNLQEQNHYEPEQQNDEVPQREFKQEEGNHRKDIMPGEKYYPTVGEINAYVDKKYEQVQQHQQLQQPNVNQGPMNPSLTTLKQHKSNNPFGYEDGANLFTSPPAQQQQQQGQNINTQPIYQNIPNQSVAFANQNAGYQAQQNIQLEAVSPQQPSQQLQQQIELPPQQQQQQSPQLSVVSPVSPNFQQQPYPAMTSNLQQQQWQQHQELEGKSGSSPIPQPASANQYVSPPSVSSSSSPHSPIMAPPPVPPHPSKRLANQNQRNNSEQTNKRESSLESVPPEMPPHPVKERLESSLIDLSSPEKKPKRNDSLTGNRKSERERMSIDHKEKFPAAVHRSSSHKTPHEKKLISPPTTESIEFDLERAKRKSLDLKMQRLAIETQNLQDGNRISRNSQDNESISQAKKSFEQSRLSLDLERLNDEALRDQKRKHRLFGRLRSDKKI